MSSPWNHGKISRFAAEELLIKNGTDGAFLVRQSESVNDAYVLSLWFEGMVHHFRILKQENKFVVKASSGGSNSVRFFNSLEEVIELFRRANQGLPHELTYAIVKQSCNEVDSDDEGQDHAGPEYPVDEVDGPMEVENDDIGSIFLAKMAAMDLSGFNSDFCNNVRCYLNAGFERDGKKVCASKPATDLQDLVVKSAGSVKRELKDFLKRIGFLQQLLCTDDNCKKLGLLDSASSAPHQGETARTQVSSVVRVLGPVIGKSGNVSEYDDIVQDFAKCVAGIKSLQVLAQKAHQEHANLLKDEQSQTRTFEVTSCGGFKTRSYIKVDITEGKLWFMKNEKDSYEDCTIVEHDKILQLVKDPDTPKLTLKITKSNREYLCKDIQARENLCQLVQHMMNTHDPSKKELKKISIFVGTWNMGSASPPQIESWLKCSGTGDIISDINIDVLGHDMYVVGTQESSVGETAWVSKLKMVLKKQFKIDYYTVETQSLWGIRLVILAKPQHKNRISRIEKSSVKTGIANTLGNKGGVGISFDFLSTSLCFINCHLASGNEDLRKQRRQQNYMDILKGLNLGHKSAYDLTNQFHHVFWFGDLNYRIDMQYEDIMEAIKVMDYKKLSCKDQLKKEQLDGNAFVNFHESIPQFPPTYRYKRGTRDSYEHIKVKRAGNRINVPSWCDRVLWTSFPDLNVKQSSYGCTNDIMSSDHSPVFASFEVPITSQFVASPDQGRTKSQTSKASCKINIPLIKVKIKTVSKTDFYLEFISVCLATSEKSRTGRKSSPWDPSRTVNSNPTLTSYLEWIDTLPELNPILDDPDYLREQHLLIAVKSEAGDESYGECVISLQHHLYNMPQEFESDLTHGGVKAGEIRGKMNVINPKQPTMRKPPVYEKPDLEGNPSSSKIHNRPVSCVTPPVAEIISSPNKSASLGRKPPSISGHSLGRTSSSPKNISTYITLPEVTSTTTTNNLVDQMKIDKSPVPPPLPAKKYSSKSSALPETVDAFLSKLGLGCYLSILEENGFDDITFLEHMCDQDLKDSGITNVEHIRKIIDEVEHLRKSGVFQS